MPAIPPVPGNEEANQILAALLFFTDQEARFHIRHPHVSRKDPSTLQLSVEHYESILDRYTKLSRKTKAERQTLQYLRYLRRRTKARLHPSVMDRIVYSTLGERVLNYLA